MVNLIPNPGFEVDLSDWSTHQGSATFTRDTGTVYAGAGSGKVVALENESVRAQGFDVEENVEYSYAVAVNGEAGKTLRVQGPEAGYGDHVLAGGWEIIERSFPAAQSGGAFLIFQAIGAAQTFYLDDVVLEVPSDVTFPSGATTTASALEAHFRRFKLPAFASRR